MKKTSLAWIVTFLVIVVVVIFVTKSKPAEDYVIKIANISAISSKLPLEIAQQKGFFKDVGINVKTIELSSSNLVSDALIRGDIDITPEISIVPYLTSDVVDPGKMKLFSVTDFTADAPFDSILVKSDSPIKSITDLKNKKIGVFPGTTATNMLKLFLKDNGIDVASIRFVQLAPAEQLVALSVGSIDALNTFEPNIAIALADGKVRKIFGSVYAKQLNHSPIGVGILSTSFVNLHPKEAYKVVQALNRAYDYIRTNEEGSRTLMASVYNFNSTIAAKVSLPYLNHSNKIDKDVVNKFVDLLVSAGELKFKPDLTNAYYQ